MAELEVGFDQFAVEYDFWMRTVRPPAAYQQIVDLLPQPAGNVLEVGCGAGQLALFLADACAHVTAIDSSATMIARAEQARRAQGKDNVEFLVADIATWPLPEAHYDFIVSTYALHHTDMALIPRQLRGALRPGGRLFIRDLVCQDSETWRTSNRYHRQRALKELPPLVQKHGLQAAWRITRFRLHPTWIQHLRADQVFSAPITEQMYKDHLPGSIFWVNQEEYSVLWNAPHSVKPIPAVASPDSAQSSPPDQPTIDLLPWRQAVWEPERFAKTAIERSVVQVFEQQVAHSSHTMAIKMGERSLTYAQLNAQANRLARHLITERGEQAEPIALLFTDPIDTIVALLAVLKAGKFYTVLNPVQPAAALAQICRDAGAALLITDTAQLSAVQSWATDLPVCNCEEVSATIAADNLLLPLTADHLAGIYYTSGSSGAPKGIVRDHRQLLHSTWHNTNAYQITANDRHSLLYSLALTAAVPDLLDPLLNGATLYPFDPKTSSVSALMAWLSQEEITLLHLPVVLFRRLLDALQNEETGNALPRPHFPKLRMVILAGQSIYKPDVERFRRLFGPTCQLLYRLAMTEAGSVTHLVLNQQSEVGEIIPVGYPTADKTILLVDETGNEVKPGATGQIAIRSRYLSAGYWQNPTLTASKFLIDPQDHRQRIYLSGDQGRWQADGALEYLGRQDNMVKIRGYRVELGAIENALLTIDLVKESAVVARDDAAGNKQLIGYLVPRAAGLTTSNVRQRLLQSLPEYMIPSHFVLLAALPQTLNGKVDQQALPSPGHERPELDTAWFAPRNAMESQLVALWEELLGIEPVGIQDDFFALGGHSLLMLRLLAQVEQTFQQAIPLRAFIVAPTIARLATLLETSPTPSEDKLPFGGEQGVQKTLEQPGMENHTGTEDEQWQFLDEALDEKSAIRQRWKNLHTQRPRSRPLAALLRLPQPVAMQLLASAVQQPWVQQHYLPKQTALVQAFLAGLESMPDDPLNNRRFLVAQSLFFGCLSHFNIQHAIFHRMRAEKRAIAVEGRELLARAGAQQQGVILLGCHTYQAPYFRSLQLTQGGIMALNDVLKKSNLPPTTAANLLYTSQLEDAYQRLKQGGVISLAADANRGEATQITLPFHGRMRPFRTTFAELALMTQAQLFFVASDLQRYNQFSFRLVGPFDHGNPTMSHEERVHHLVEQYVAQLRLQWAKQPWAISWQAMSTQLAYPPLENA